MSNDVALLAEAEGSGALHELGLTLPTDITQDRYEAMGVLLGRVHETMKWAVGDWLFQGEALWGEDVYQLQESLGLSVPQRLQYVRVSGDVPLQRRVKGLTWSHHRSVAPLEAKQQTEWLQKALANKWTKQELEAELKIARDGKDSSPAARRYVVEAVCDAAEHIWDAAERSEDGTYLVPGEAMQELANALGIDA